MNHELLLNKIEEYKADLERNSGKHSQDWQDRNELCLFYQSHTSSTLSNIDEEGLLEYLSPLWSMLIWGNKRYIVDRYFLWNRRAKVGLHYLGVKVPRYDYQLKGETYKRLCQVGQKIAEEMGKAGLQDISLLAVDYFIWDQLQVEPTLSQIRVGQQENGQGLVAQDVESKEAQFIHNDIRDKLKYWDYENVLQVHESLQFVNESINELGLVPESF